MSYKLEQPYTDEQKADFIVKYNHNQGLRIEEVDNFVDVEVSIENEDGGITTEIQNLNMPTLYALEPFEKLVDGEVIDNTEEYEEEKAKQEAERIAMLNLTAADVERGIYKAKGMDFDDIIVMVTQLQPENLDIKALKIELKANHFYRGNSYVNAIGNLLGFTSEQLDKFFETNNYTYLISETSEV